MKRLKIVLFLLSFSLSLSAQNINIAHTRLSILTCGPGDELYSLFGHTAIRIFDSTSNIDVVYNWGGFTFDQPNFYLNFVRGTLLYYSTEDYFNDFMSDYIIDQRSVYEQILNMDSAAKQKIIDAVIFNSTGDNKFYKYDGYSDNCTTRVKNIVYQNLQNAVITANIVPEGTTKRDLMHYYLENGDQLWSELGLDIIVGSTIDKKISNDEAMYLPEFFMKGLNNTKYKSAPLVKEFKPILQGADLQKPSWKYLPLAIMSAICLLIFFISTLKASWSKSVIRFVDALLLYITGLLGIFILVMWFATDHIECKNNYNLLWALPFNFPVAFFLYKKPAWLSNYFFIASVITAVFLATWFWLPQQINIALLPVVILLLDRYVHLANKFRRLHK